MLPFGCSHRSPMAFSSVVSVNHPLDLIPLDLSAAFSKEILIPNCFPAQKRRKKDHDTANHNTIGA